jgi:hypothetical protein
MLRHIIPVTLAITACASLIPIKANAAYLTLEPSGPLLKNPGDIIEFVLALDPNFPDNNGNEVEFRSSFFTYDDTELSLLQPPDLLQPGTQFSTPTILGRYIFTVLQPVKDTVGDVSAIVNYWEKPTNTPRVATRGGPFYDVEPVPEPLTIFGTATALGCGVLFKRKSSKKTVS